MDVVFNSRKSAFLGYFALSTAVAIYAVIDALSERPNLYSAGIKLSKGFHIITLGNWFVCMSLVLGKAFQRIMFGELRIIEIEHIYERSWFTITNLLMALAMFRYDNNLLIFSLIMGLLFLKVFHWVLTDRLDYLLQRQQQSLNGEIRIRDIILTKPTFTLLIFLIVDYKIVMSCIDHSFLYSADVFVVFGLDFLMVYLDLLESTLNFILEIIEIIYVEWNHGQTEEDVWENKVWLSKIGLILISIFRLLAVGFVFIGLIYAYIIPVNFTRDVYLAVVKLIEQLKDLIYLIRARRELERNLKDPTEEDLERGDICIICREDMALNVSDRNSRDFPKKLNCGHVLHYGCLKSWLERSHVCPTCRSEVFKPRSGRVEQQQDTNQQQGPNHHHHGDDNQIDREQQPPAPLVQDQLNFGEPNQAQAPAQGQTTTTTTTITNKSFSIRLPKTTVIPPDWTILPLRRVTPSSNNDTVDDVNGNGNGNGNGNENGGMITESITNTTTSSGELLFQPLNKQYDVLLNKESTFRLKVVSNKKRGDSSTNQNILQGDDDEHIF